MPKEPDNHHKKSINIPRTWLQWHHLQLAVLVLLVVVVVLGQLRISNLETAERLGSYPNQACVGVATGLKHGVKLDSSTSQFDVGSSTAPVFNGGTHAAGEIGRQTCWVEQVITKQIESVDGSLKKADGYSLGASTMYFQTPGDASRFGAQYNKHHYWSVDESGVQAGFPQSSLFTFIETNAAKPYFDAYTVRDKTAFFISLPCDMTVSTDINLVYDACNKNAQVILEQFANNVQDNLAINPLF